METEWNAALEAAKQALDALKDQDDNAKDSAMWNNCVLQCQQRIEELRKK
jgi:hypothetical protein